jgi:two-component sensor histidine kinase
MSNISYDHALAHAIVDTIREPLLVIDEDLCVVAASRSYCRFFEVANEDTVGRRLDELGGGQWNIPTLQEALRRIWSASEGLEGFEVDAVIPRIGRRVMVLNARKVSYQEASRATVLLAIEDITKRRAIERELADLMREKELLLLEMQHRVANSLQIIASILLIKARSVTSEETRTHLHDAHERVLAVAAVQKHLHATVGPEAIELQPYLTQLCKSLADSMIGEARSIELEVLVGEGRATSSEAVSLGLIVTELMINALKHAFPVAKRGNKIVVRYESNASGWRLALSDNGVGKLDENSPFAKIGLGTSIVAALAEQLRARVETTADASGTSVSVTHATFDTAGGQPL